MGDTEKLLALREEYKQRLEQSLRDNQMKGINFLIDKAFSELFNDLAKNFEFYYKGG